jgi:integrase
MLHDFATDLQVAGFAPSTVAEYCRILGHIPYQLPGTVRDAKNWLAQRREHVGQATLIVETRALKAFSRWWADEMGEDDPLARLVFPKAPAPLPGPVARDQDITRVRVALMRTPKLYAANRRDLALLDAFIWTGARRSEIAGMRLGDLDFETRRITFPDTKNGDARLVPMAPELARSLRAWLRQRGQHRLAHLDAVWLGRDGPLRADSLTAMLHRISAEAGLTPPLRAHSFRRRFAHEWALRGGADDTLMIVAGWRNSTMPARYRSELVRDRALIDYDRMFGSEVRPQQKLRPGRRRLHHG